MQAQGKETNPEEIARLENEIKQLDVSRAGISAMVKNMDDFAIGIMKLEEEIRGLEKVKGDSPQDSARVDVEINKINLSIENLKNKLG